MTSDHARPGPADMRAALATARAVLSGADEAAHEAAQGGSCPACTTKAAVSFGFALASTMASVAAEQKAPPMISPEVAAAMLAAVDAADAELRSSGN